MAQSMDTEAGGAVEGREEDEGAGRVGGRGRRVVRAVLTAGIPGGPTAAVRIDQEMYQWIRHMQARHPCT